VARAVLLSSVLPFWTNHECIRNVIVRTIRALKCSRVVRPATALPLLFCCSKKSGLLKTRRNALG
jgi:hypothetical protein